MEYVITVDIKSFLFSNSLISDYQFRFRPCPSTLDMLLLLPQQWWRPSISDMWSEPSLWTYLELLVQSGILPWFSKLSAYGIQGQLHSWITDHLHSRRPRVVLNGTLSSPLPVKAGVLQGSVIGTMLFLIFINDPTDSLENPLSLCWWCYSAVRSLILLTDRQQPLPSPQNLTKSQTGQTQFCLCIPIAHPLRLPLPFIVTCIPCLSISIYFLPLPCCWCFPLSPGVSFTLCPDLFCVIALPQA